jgi:peroxiredoxin
MRKLSILIIGIVLVFISCISSNTPKYNIKSRLSTPFFTVKGYIAGIDSAQGILTCFITEQEQPFIIKNGLFEIKGTITEPQLVSLNIKNKNEEKVLSFFIEENNSISIKASIEDFENAQIMGNAFYREDSLYKKEIATPLSIKRSKLYDIEDKAIADKNQNILDSIKILNNQMDTEELMLLLKYAEKNPKSYLIANYACQAFSYAKNSDTSNFKTINNFYKTLDKQIQNADCGKKIKSQIDAVYNTQLGHIAPNFNLLDSTGKIIKLSDYRGKIVLLDFWASWCQPCRKENPNILKIHQEYQSKGLIIIGVSIDTKKESWLKAIQKDNLAWLQIIDDKGWESRTAKNYDIKAIPLNFILDKEGKIIAKNVFGKELEKQFKIIFN